MNNRLEEQVNGYTILLHQGFISYQMPDNRGKKREKGVEEKRQKNEKQGTVGKLRDKQEKIWQNIIRKRGNEGCFGGKGEKYKENIGNYLKYEVKYQWTRTKTRNKKVKVE